MEQDMGTHAFEVPAFGFGRVRLAGWLAGLVLASPLTRHCSNK